MDLIKVREQLNLGIPLTNIRLRVTDYSRVSTNHEEQKSSLNNQINYFNKYIKDNPNWEYVEGYIDEGISGTTSYKRNNFMRMIQDAKDNKFDLIITKEISRFSRNTLDSIKYTRELLNYGVAVLFINDNINTALPDSELRLTIMSSLAQDEIRRLSERVKFGMRESIKNGNILGNNKLYGYRKNKNKLKIVKEESIIIKDIFYKYVVDNYSLNRIAKLYNFSVTKVSRIIRNPKYKGYYCGRKSEVIDYISKKIKYLDSDNWITYKDKKIPKIVDENIWNRANIKLKNNNKKITKNKYPLSEKIYCKKDNYLYYFRKQKNNNYWLCSNYIKNSKKSCSNKILKEKILYNSLEKVFIKLGINKYLLENKLSIIYNKNIIIDKKQFINKLIDLIIEKIEVDNNKLYISFYNTLFK